MSSDVRVHVRLGAVRVVFQGEQSFYEKHVESLVVAAAKRGAMPATPGGAASGHGSVSHDGAEGAGGDDERDDDDQDDRDRESGAPPPAPEPTGFVPASGEFGRYIRKLGPEAAEPDRQVVALAFYLWNYEKRPTFGVAELKGCFRALGLALPTHIDEILADLTDRKRFLEPADDGSWRLSRKGENYVKTRLLAA
jgi:hypothetical protein